MIPAPATVGVWVCERVIIDAETGQPSLIGILTALPVSEIPSQPQQVSVVAELAGGHGMGLIELTVWRLATMEQVHGTSAYVRFPDRIMIVRVYFRMHGIEFPAPGVYEFRLSVDDEMIAQRRLRVYSAGG